jgi:drug/metabolite transporter (DMT)-like permease
VLDGMPYPLLVWLRRTPQQRREIVAYARQRWPKAALGGTASIGSYAIALWAMTRAPVASVAALRETSGAVRGRAGHLAAEGEVRPQRALGTLVVVLGVMALRLG